MPYSQKYCLVSFISPLDVNIEFAMSDWPLHITLADVFEVNLDIDLTKGLSELLTKQSLVVATASKETTLGVTEVVLLDKNNGLLSLHTSIVEFLTSKGTRFNNPEFTKEGFLPHCTIQKAGKLNPGDKITIDIISLIDMLPGSNWQQRKVLQNFKLGN